jgi:S-adenosylmethionine:tRNA-ribosyltransferase-isomerase (queuine synthetase)
MHGHTPQVGLWHALSRRVAHYVRQLHDTNPPGMIKNLMSHGHIPLDPYIDDNCTRPFNAQYILSTAVWNTTPCHQFLGFQIFQI